jgi:transcriptional regulator with XRE-family HTH domain
MAMTTTVHDSSPRHTIDEQLIEIGRALRERRIRVGLTQEDLARQADLSLGAVKNLENGKGSSVRSLLRVSRLLESEQWVDVLRSSATPAVSPMQLLRQQKVARTSNPRVRRSRKAPSP